jgi:hypothetical protein
VKSVKLNGEFFIKEFVAGLEKTLADYPEGTEQEVVRGGAEGLECLMRLGDAMLTAAGISDSRQEQLFSRVRALHAALVSPDHSQYVAVTRAINKSWNNYNKTVQQAYMAIGLELRREGWPSESEKTAAKTIAAAFNVLDEDSVPDTDKVIGWRTTAKRKSPKYPLLRDQFSMGLRLLKDAYPDQPQQQYEVWRNFVAAKWKAKI